MQFVDTNYFLRLLLNDNTLQHRTAKGLFEEGAQGKVALITSLIVLFEVYWVLSSFYKRKKTELIPILGDILSMEFIIVKERLLLQEALMLFRARSIDLEDAYNIVYAKAYKSKSFATFDKKLSKLFLL